MKRILSPTAIALILGGCAAETGDLTVELESLRQAALAYASAASAKDAEAVVAFYDTDAMMIPPNAAMVEGLDGVRAYRFGFIETEGVELDFELVHAVVSAAGDIGWTLAIGDITIRAEGAEPGRDIVRDFHTWKKQPDGSWKITVDVWNSGVVPGS